MKTGSLIGLVTFKGRGRDAKLLDQEQNRTKRGKEKKEKATRGPGKGECCTYMVLIAQYGHPAPGSSFEPKLTNAQTVNPARHRLPSVREPAFGQGSSFGCRYAAVSGGICRKVVYV